MLPGPHTSSIFFFALHSCVWCFFFCGVGLEILCSGSPLAQDLTHFPIPFNTFPVVVFFLSGPGGLAPRPRPNPIFFFPRPPSPHALVANKKTSYWWCFGPLEIPHPFFPANLSLSSPHVSHDFRIMGRVHKFRTWLGPLYVPVFSSSEALRAQTLR